MLLAKRFWEFRCTWEHLVQQRCYFMWHSIQCAIIMAVTIYGRMFMNNAIGHYLIPILLNLLIEWSTDWHIIDGATKYVTKDCHIKYLANSCNTGIVGGQPNMHALSLLLCIIQLTWVKIQNINLYWCNLIMQLTCFNYGF